MPDQAFMPEADEGEVEYRSGVAVSIGGGRGKMGTVVLTNDRILFTHQKFAQTGTGGALGALVADQLQQRSEKKAGGPTEVLALADVRRAYLKKRRMLPDLFEFALADGSTCWFSKDIRKHWDGTIRRLLTERHGRTVVDDGAEGWHVE